MVERKMDKEKKKKEKKRKEKKRSVEDTKSLGDMDPRRN